MALHGKHCQGIGELVFVTDTGLYAGQVFEDPFGEDVPPHHGPIAGCGVWRWLFDDGMDIPPRSFGLGGVHDAIARDVVHWNLLDSHNGFPSGFMGGDEGAEGRIFVVEHIVP